MTAAEQVARALRESECCRLECKECLLLQPCPTNIVLAEFVEAADDVYGLAGFHAAFPRHALTAYDAALKRLAEVLR